MRKKKIGVAKVSSREIKTVLKSTFGLDELRPLQAEVIKSVLDGEPTLAIMPTGAGKSLCYQIPAVLLPGTTLVVSPLIALMKDQKEKMDELHIAASQLNSSLSETDQSKSLKKVTSGKTDILYTTPERLSDPEFLKSMSNTKIDLLVVDEAHCITQWGHDFRPAFLAIPEAWVSLGKPRFLALTATATSEVVADIQKQMGFTLNVYHSGVLRENLCYEARHAENESEKLTQLLDLVKNENGSGIIYSATVAGVESIVEALTRAGISALRYHGKLSAKERNENQTSFMKGDVSLIVATNAFGMGIDKANIRYVIHYHFPGSLEAYYQESGRAGRDGKRSRCVLLYLKKDKSTQTFFLAGKYPTVAQIKLVYETIEAQTPLEEINGLAKSKIKVIVAALKELSIVKQARGAGLELLKNGLTEAELATMAAGYLAKKQSDHDKLKQMIVYAQSALCRWKMILRYFDQEVDWQLCGHCDNCARSASHLVEEREKKPCLEIA